MENNMKYMKLFENFEVDIPIQQRDWLSFREINEKYKVVIWKKKNIITHVNKQFSYTTDFNLIEYKGKLKINSFSDLIPEGWTFKECRGDVKLKWISMKNLYGSPEKCVSFNAHMTGIETLKGGPKYVEEDYIVSYNNIISLEGAPFKCKIFECVSCDKLEDLYFDHQELEIFICNSCSSLKTLKGAPQRVKKFDCSSCNLESLEGAPQEVENFICSDNNKLTNLKGAPQKVNYFSCNSCDNLESLEGAPQEVENFYCGGRNKLSNYLHAPKIIKNIFWAEGPNGHPYSLVGIPSSKDLEIDVSRTGILTFKGLGEYGSLKDLWCNNLLVAMDDNGNMIQSRNAIFMDVHEVFITKEERLTRFINDLPSIPKEVWFEAVVFIQKRNPALYEYMKKKIPMEWFDFDIMEVLDFYKSDLIDYESTLADAAKAGLPIPQEIMDRTKKYDHSEYRDSKLDSEWKDVF